MERKHVVVLLVIAALVIFGIGYKLASLNNVESTQDQDIFAAAKSEVDELPSTDPAEGDVKEQEKEIFVHVVGAVEKPGVYRLPEGARVVDAIDKALPTPDARLDLINLAAPIPDGQQLTVFSEEDYQNAIATVDGGEGLAAQVPGSAVSAPSNPVNPFENGSTSGQGLININTAGQAELETLPGIGPALAGRIIKYRESTRFLSPEDIKNVSGIGDKRFEQIKDAITVN